MAKSAATKPAVRKLGRAAVPVAPSFGPDLEGRRLGVESLEDRVFLSVTQDANGYTVVNLNAGDPVVYVDNRPGVGSDSNPGTITQPLATVTAGRNLLASKLGLDPTAGGAASTGGALLLRRGDVFVGAQLANFNFSGVSTAEPILIGSYAPAGDPTTARPVLLTGNSQTGFSTPMLTSRKVAGGVNYVDLIGVAFEDQFRDPTMSTFDPSQSGGQYGFASIGPSHDILVEDCSFQYYGANNGTNIDIQDGTASGFGAVSNFTFRRNYIANSWMSGTTTLHYDSSTNNFVITGTTNRAEGLFASGVNGITLDGNIFEHDGWSETIPYAGANIYSHDCYLYGDNTGCVVTNNLFADAASHGLQARSGGVVKNNLFLRDAVAMSFGYVNGAYSTPGGVTGVVDGNVVVEDKDISGSARGWGIEIGNTSPNGTTVVQNNVFSMDLQANSPAIHLDYGSNSDRAQEVGVNNLTIQNNTVYGWSQGLSINQYFQPGGNPNDPNTGYKALNNVKILNNNFQGIQATPIIENGPTSLSQETWSGNQYDDINAGGSGWFRIGPPATTKPIDFSTWKQSYEPSALMTRITYPAPNRTAASYNAAIGGSGSLAAFLAQASQQTKLYYRPQYTVGAVASYIKAGFSLTSGLATVTVNAPDITAGGPLTRAFSLTYNDPQGINLGTLDSNDVVVTGPNGYSQAATFLGYSSSADGTKVTATYSIPGPGGNAWSSTYNTVGTNTPYTISVQPNQVTDKLGSAVAAGPVGTFNVNINSAAPTARVSSVDSNGLISVVYSDPNKVSFNSVGANNITVTDPSGQTVVANYQRVLGSGNAPSLTVQYQATPTSGGFVAGVYTISIGSKPVTNVPGTPVPTDAVGTFTISGDNVAPNATASAPDVVLPGSTAPLTITATYTDNVSVNAATINSNSLTVVGPNNYSQPVTLTNSPSSGATTAATFSLAAPAGGWQASYNGTYSLIGTTTGSGVVADTSGNPIVGGAIGTFKVNIDVQPPKAQANTFDITSGGTFSERLYVTYADASGINLNTISAANLRVTGPNNFNQPVTILPVTDSTGKQSNYILPTNASNIAGVATPVSVVYAVAPPSGGWTPAANGTYNIVMQANQVNDGAPVPNYVPGGTVIGTFNVTLGSTPTPTPAPTASMSIAPATSPSSTPIDKITITFTQPVTGFDLSDLTFSRNGGPNLLTSSQTLTTTDNTTFVLGNLTPLTTGGGSFTLTLTATGSGIQNSSGVALGNSPSISFAVTPATPITAPTFYVNDGTAQRSKVTNLTVAFNTPVTLSANSITLTQRAGPAGAAGGNVPLVVTNPSGDGMTYLVTFTGDSGVPLDYDSLPDGVYDLTVHSGTVTNSAGTLLNDATLTFHRLFGDVTGDGIVNNLDAYQFQSAYATAVGGPAPGYNSAVDFNADGVVNNLDAYQFQLRYATQVSPA